MNLTCETCNAPTDDAGVACKPCHRGRLASLLNSKPWCAVAATRTGDLPGETLLDTIKREHNHS